MSPDVLIRLSAFTGVLGLMALWEIFVPRRQLNTPKMRRWIANLSVVVLDSAIVRLLFSAGAVGTALLGIALFDEPANAGRLVSLGLIVLGIIGLKLASPG